MDDVTQYRGKNVLSQASDQQNYIFHLHNLTAYQEHNAKRHIPERQKTAVKSCINCMCIVGLLQVILACPK